MSSARYRKRGPIISIRVVVPSSPLTLDLIRDVSGKVCSYAVAILAQAISSSRSSLLVREVSIGCFFSRGVMPRRGWSSMDVPTGWVQVLRGPKPPSQKRPSVLRPGATSQVLRSGGHVQSNHVQPTRVNPDASHEFPRAKIAKLEQALEVMGVPGACCRGVEGGAGEHQGCGEATSN